MSEFMYPDVILEVQDLRYLTWARIRNSSGTAGSYLKAYETIGGVKRYYKLSCFDPVRGITGHESVNEIIVDRLLQILGIDHLSYQLIHGVVEIGGKEYETYITASEDFKHAGETKTAFDDYYLLDKKPNESIWDFLQRKGWSKYIYEMLVVDYLILNRDRHGANIEVLRDRSTRLVRLSPLFDHGLSLLYSCVSENEASAFDVMEDRPVQCFFGGRSASDNLKLIPEEQKPVLRRLEERDGAFLFRNLENVLPEIYRDKIWEMIWRRWQHYEDL